MKLIVFCPYYPPHIGGLETHADEFNKHLSREGVEITVFTPQLPGEARTREVIHDHVVVIRFPAFEIIPNYPLPKFWRFQFWRLYFSLFDDGYDIAVSRTRFFSTSILALVHAKTTGTKWLHIEHGSDFVKLHNPVASAVARVYDHTLGRLVFSLSDRNVANSQASARFVMGLSRGKPCEVVRRGVEVDSIEEIAPNRHLAAEHKDSVIIVYIGRLIDGKGVADLIRALALLRQEGIRCFVVGDGPQRSALELLAQQLGLSGRITFFGHQRIDDALAIVKVADIVVNPSYTEGLPTSVIEAAICKKAILATDVGGTPEIVTNEVSGLLFEAGNVEALRDKLTFLLTNPRLRERYGNQAQLDVANKFRWKAAVEKYVKIFAEMTSARGTRGDRQRE